MQETMILFDRFKQRGYPYYVLQNCKIKVDALTREEILRPKTLFLIKHLEHNYPNILSQYSNVKVKETGMQNKTFIIMPFYKNMFGFKKLFIDFILNEMKKGQNVNYKNIISQLNIIMSFTKTNQLQRYCKPTK
jgi:hypothetical protein